MRYDPKEDNVSALKIFRNGAPDATTNATPKRKVPTQEQRLTRIFRNTGMSHIEAAAMAKRGSQPQEKLEPFTGHTLWGGANNGDSSGLDADLLGGLTFVATDHSSFAVNDGKTKAAGFNTKTLEELDAHLEKLGGKRAIAENIRSEKPLTENYYVKPYADGILPHPAKRDCGFPRLKSIMESLSQPKVTVTATENGVITAVAVNNTNPLTDVECLHKIKELLDKGEMTLDRFCRVTNLDVYITDPNKYDFEFQRGGDISIVVYGLHGNGSIPTIKAWEMVEKFLATHPRYSDVEPIKDWEVPVWR